MDTLLTVKNRDQFKDLFDFNELKKRILTKINFGFVKIGTNK